jgi:adenylate cyclase
MDNQGRMKDGVTQPGGFEEELARQTLMSERSRSLILMVVFLAVFGVLLAYRAIELEKHTPLPNRGATLLIFVGSALFEWGVSRIVARQLRTGKGYAPYRAYIGATLEIAIPTLVMFLINRPGNTLRSLTGPVSFTYFIFIILSSLRLDPWKSVFTGAISAVAYGSLVVASWHELAAEWVGSGSIFMSFFMRIFFLVIGGLSAAFVSMQIRKALFETLRGERERERIVGLFGQQVSPAVVNQLLSQPTGTASELREICVMVLDIRNFTTFSERRTPEEVVAYLNTLWGAMVRIVNEHNGWVSKFLGDGFLAVFGAPISHGSDCDDAIAATRRILLEVKSLETSGSLPPTRIGLALHAGQAIVGNVGCDERKEYTVIGDVVNVAFRIEALNKEIGSTALISEPVRKAAAVQDAESIAPIPIRGHKEPVQLYRLA